ncbi:MAG: lanthionine synthetase LanC family protein [Thermoanaerobaculia bacterium]
MEESPLESINIHPFLEAAWNIAGLLKAHATYTRSGRLAWYHPPRPTASIPSTLLGPQLYHGSLGIALFLAAAGRIFDDGELRDLCLETVSPLRREIREIVGDPIRSRRVEHPLGALVGLGSILYGLLHIGDALGDSTVLDDAHAVSALITSDRISAEENWDVMGGLAGALLALLALHRRRPGENLNGWTALKLASECGRCFIAGAQRRPEGWPDFCGHPGPNGYCHGVSGIATALLGLFQETGTPDLLKVARQAFAYERALYVPAVKNWILSSCKGAGFANSWCKGAPGIAISRLSALGIFEDHLVGSEVETALATTGDMPLSETDDLCCGNAGRLDILIYASERLEDPALLRSALNLGSQFLVRARREGGYALKLARVGILDLRLFPGLAGIGYAFLRLATKRVIPCVLALQ